MSYETVLSLLPGFAADVLVKATLLMTVVAILEFSMRRYSAAMRHRLWATAFIGMLLSPILSFAVPAYRLAILPAEWFVNEPIAPTDDGRLSTVQVEAPAKSELFAETAESFSPLVQRDLQIADAQSPTIESLPSGLQSVVQSQLPLAPVAVFTDRPHLPLEWFRAIVVFGLSIAQHSGSGADKHVSRVVPPPWYSSPRPVVRNGEVHRSHDLGIAKSRGVGSHFLA